MYSECPYCDRDGLTERGVIAHVRQKHPEEYETYMQQLALDNTNTDEEEDEVSNGNGSNGSNPLHEIHERLDVHRPGMLEAPESPEERSRRLRRETVRDALNLAEVAVRMPRAIPVGEISHVADKIAETDPQVGLLAYLGMMDKMSQSLSNMNVAAEVMLKTIEQCMREDGTLGDGTSLDIGRQSSLDSVMSAIADNIRTRNSHGGFHPQGQ